jgi:hypothetical protein
MKVSRNLLVYLLHSVLGGTDEIIKHIFEDDLSEFDTDFIVTSEVHKELASIANKFDTDFKLIDQIGDEIYVEFDGEEFEIRMPGAGDSDDSEMGYDIIGTWNINIRTGEVGFYAERET